VASTFSIDEAYGTGRKTFSIDDAYAPARQVGGENDSPADRADIKAEVEQYESENPLLTRVGQRLERGTRNLASGVQAARAINAEQSRSALGPYLDKIDAGQPWESILPRLPDGSVDNALGLTPEDVNTLRQYQGGDEEDRADIRRKVEAQPGLMVQSAVRQSQAAAAIPQNPAARRVSQAESLGEGLKAFSADPVGVVAEFGVSSAPQAAGVVGATILTRNPALSALIAAGGQEYVGSLLDGFAAQGVDVTDRAALEKAIQNPEMVVAAQAYAGKRAAAVGLGAAATGGIGGRLVSAAAGPVKKGAAGVGEVAINAGIDMTAESAAQLASTGKVSPGQVLAEGAGGALTAPAEIAGSMMARHEPGERAKAKTAQIPLSEDDINSPLPTNLIAEGRAKTADAQATNRATEILTKRGLPGVGRRVSITTPEGQTVTGVMLDAADDAPGRPDTAEQLFDEKGAHIGFYDAKSGKTFALDTPNVPGGFTIQMDDGSIFQSTFGRLEEAGYKIAEAPNVVQPSAQAALTGPAKTDQQALPAPQRSGATVTHGDGFTMAGAPEAQRALPSPDSLAGPGMRAGAGFTFQEPGAQPPRTVKRPSNGEPFRPTEPQVKKTPAPDGALQAPGPDAAPRADGIAPAGQGDGTRQAPVKVETGEHVALASQPVNTEPSGAQKEAGNYAKGHARVHGLDISIENPKGSERTGKAPDGTQWRVTMPAAYGYIKRSEGADGDQIDIYLGDNPDSARVFVVDQYDPTNHKFDETKSVVGANSREEAVAIYDGGFSDGSGPRRRAAVTEMSIDQFKEWVKSGDHKKPASGLPRILPMSRRLVGEQKQHVARRKIPAAPVESEPQRSLNEKLRAQRKRQPIERRDIEADTAVTAKGREIPVTYAVVEVDSLIPSQLDDGRQNPDFPAEMQPRDRERASSAQQINAIAQNINPRLLDRSPKASDGAPIISPDGVVESGNGRALGIRRAYALGKAEAYRAHLARQGYPVGGMRRPVLVRVRTGEMSESDRKAFTREANERDTLVLSATEQAMADASAMPDSMLDLFRGGEIDAAGNREFVRAFIKQVVGANEQAGIVAADGAPSQAAIKRIQAALLAKAYGDEDLVSEIAEATDTNVKAIGGALTDVAPLWAQMRAAGQRGEIDPSMDQTGPLLDAVKLVQRARREERSVAEYAGQTDIFSGRTISHAGEAFLRLFYRNTQGWTSPTGRDKIAGALQFYVTEAHKTTSGVDVLGEAAAAPTTIIDVAKRRQYGGEPEQPDLLAQPARGDGGDAGARGQGRERRDQAAAPARGEEAARTGKSGAGPNQGKLAARREKAEAEHPDDTPQQAALRARMQSKQPGSREITDEAKLELTGAEPEDRAQLRDEPPQPNPEAIERLGRLARDLESRLAELGISSHLGLNIADKIEQLVDGKLTAADGRYFERIIEVAIDAKDPAWVLNHEAIHALRDLGLFRDAEWATLRRAARADTARTTEMDRLYPGLDEDAKVEEAIADTFADWKAGGMEAGGFLKSAFAKIKSLIEALGNWLRGAGFNSAEDIFWRVKRGEVGARRSDGQRGGDPRLHAAWHGSAQDNIDRFSTDYIGTGEGAQAYGWGLYFVDRKGVANHYRRQNAGGDVMVKGFLGRWRPFNGLDEMDSDYGKLAFRDFGSDLDAVMERINERLQKHIEMRDTSHTKEARQSWDNKIGPLESDMKRLEKIKVNGGIRRAGATYEVDLAPTEDQYLDWDKPLNEQSQAVKDAMDKIAPFIMDTINDGLENSGFNGFEDKPRDESEYTGRDFYKLLVAAQKRESSVAEALGIDDPSNPQEAASKYLLSLGVRGNRYLDQDSRRAGEGTRNYVIFDESDVKITAKYALRRDATNPFADTATERADGAVADALSRATMPLFQNLRSGATLDALRRGVDVWRWAFQDQFIDLRNIQREIARALGRPLAEAENPYLRQELMDSRIGPRLEKLSDTMVAPLVEGIRSRLGDGGLDLLEDYLYARHAKERNARVAAINPKFAPGEGSGMTDAEADAMMAKLEKHPKIRDIKALASQVNDILDFALKTRVEAGLLSQEQADAWRASYEHYVPLRGNAELDPTLEGERPSFGGTGLNVKGKESKRALGRKSRADDILAHVVMQAQEAIVRAERNEVGKALHELATAAPDSSFWTVDKVDVRPVFNSARGVVEYRPIHMLTGAEERHTVSLKIDGKEHRVTFNRQDSRASRLADSMRNLSGQDFAAVVRTLGAVNRFLSTVNTTLNPEFIVTNAFRDIQAAAVNISQYDVPGITRNTLRDYRKALVAAMRGVFKKGKGDEWSKWYDEFIAEGGRVYFNQIEDVAKLRDRLNKDLARKRSNFNVLQIAKTTFRYIESANMGVESAIRLSAYKNAREAGMTRAQAASLAKNLTVNFNRRGRFGPLMNTLYLFYNASVQGSFTMLSAMKSRRVQRIVAGIVASGALVEFLNAMLSGEDDDGELHYDKISDFDKERNIILMIPGTEGEHIKIPLPYGYNAFFRLGRSPVELWRGKKFGDVGASIATAFLDSFNPIGGNDSLLKITSPTISDPIVELETNRDYADRPIMPDQAPFGPQKPDAQRYWESVNPMAKWITDTLTTVSGGDEVRPGGIDISPETIEHLFGTGTGAAGTFYERNVCTFLKLFDPTAEIEWNDLPFVRKVVGQAPAWYDRSAFYERAAEIEQAWSDLKEYRERGDKAAARAFLEQNRDLIRLRDHANAARERLSDIRAKKDILKRQRSAGEITADTYAREIEKLKDIEQALMSRFNGAYMDATDGR
jgi:hypothetical protein